MRVWRLTAKRFASTPFDGIGNQKAGSRWVPASCPAVYTSEHAATTILENLVHMEPAHFGHRYILIAADIPDDASMEALNVQDLPDDWQTRDEDAALRSLGKAWLDRANSAFLIVPSAIVPEERNIIVNPRHPDIRQLIIHSQRDFAFDLRLHPRSAL